MSAKLSCRAQIEWRLAFSLSQRRICVVMSFQINFTQLPPPSSFPPSLLIVNKENLWKFYSLPLKSFSGKKFSCAISVVQCFCFLFHIHFATLLSSISLFMCQRPHHPKINKSSKIKWTIHHKAIGIYPHPCNRPRPWNWKSHSLSLTREKLTAAHTSFMSKNRCRRLCDVNYTVFFAAAAEGQKISCSPPPPPQQMK